MIHSVKYRLEYSANGQRHEQPVTGKVGRDTARKLAERESLRLGMPVTSARIIHQKYGIAVSTWINPDKFISF